MNAEDLSFVEITSLHDDLLLPWLVLYETAFPASERVLVASILSILKKKMLGEQDDMCLLAVNDPAGKIVGMAMFNARPGSGLAVLWYIAVVKELRGRGLGSIIYYEVLHRVYSLQAGTLFFEVEFPEDHNDAEARQRIRFYKKQGALLLTGIHYMQKVGWHQTPIPMHLMIHPCHPMDAQTAFNLAKSIFNDAIEQVDTLGLDSSD